MCGRPKRGRAVEGGYDETRRRSPAGAATGKKRKREDTGGGGELKYMVRVGMKTVRDIQESAAYARRTESGRGDVRPGAEERDMGETEMKQRA